MNNDTLNNDTLKSEMRDFLMQPPRLVSLPRRGTVAAAIMLLIAIVIVTFFRTEWYIGAMTMLGRPVVLPVDWTTERRPEVMDVRDGDTATLTDAQDEIRLTGGRYLIKCYLTCPDRTVQIERGGALVMHGKELKLYGPGDTFSAPRRSQ